MSKRYVPCYGSLCFRPYLPKKEPPENASITGDVRNHELNSEYLGRRVIQVYLPPGFSDKDHWSYPYALLQDGQNIFDQKSAVFGVEWGVDETAEKLIVEQVIEPVILVGIFNSDQRINEYTPFPDKDHEGGSAHLYKAFLLEELIPFLEKTYSVSRFTQDRAVIGSSLGALVSLYLGWTAPEVFGGVGALSPSLWWGNRGFITSIAGDSTPSNRPRIWLDGGLSETDMDANENGVSDLIDDLRTLRAVLVAHGYRLDEDLMYREIPEGTHDEKSWSLRIGQVLRYLFPKKTTY